VTDIALETIITVSTFRNEAVDVWIPLQISAESVKNHDKAWSESRDLFCLKNMRETTLFTARKREVGGNGL
jgi:hypothetical protein